MTKKSWIIFGAICIGLIGGLIYLSNNNKANVDDVSATDIQVASAENGNIAEHTYGNMDSKVILYEYADYQCPGCYSAYPIIKEVTEKYKDQIGYVFRNYPLTSSHPNALAAAAASESAGLEGKYWEMHNSLFTNRSNWINLLGEERTEYFASLATALGVDKEKFLSHLDDANVRKKINYDLALGQKAGVSGTPALYIGSKDVGNQKVLNGSIVSSSNTDSSATYVWASAENFEKYVIVPALEENGIELPTSE